MDVIVIGAGVGGLAAAVGLAARGARVTLLEQNGHVGGKLNVWEQGGFTFDTGPHVLTMLWALEEVFTSAGRRLEDVLDLVKLDTVCRYHFEDGDTLDASADPDEAARALTHFAPADEAGFHRFLAYARRVSEATTEPFLRQDFGAQVRGVPTPAQWGQLSEFLALKPWRTLRDVVRAHFGDPRLRQVFELYALYSGSHPARASGIFATVADVQWRQGTFYVRGGLYHLAEALREAAESLGVVIRTDTPAAEVIVKNRRACGAETRHGERLYADAVVCNADCLSALTTLVPADARRAWTQERVEKIEPSTSAFLLLLGVEGTYPQLAHHNSFLANDDVRGRVRGHLRPRPPRRGPDRRRRLPVRHRPLQSAAGLHQPVRDDQPARSLRPVRLEGRGAALPRAGPFQAGTHGADGPARAHSGGADVDPP